ncbi:hypothetical protein CAPTEDRAFT_205243, partial [Capitella teleta]
MSLLSSVVEFEFEFAEDLISEFTSAVLCKTLTGMNFMLSWLTYYVTSRVFPKLTFLLDPREDLRQFGYHRRNFFHVIVSCLPVLSRLDTVISPENLLSIIETRVNASVLRETDYNGWTPLGLMFLAMGKSSTPLHYAVFAKNADATKLLLKKGCDKDKSGRTAGETNILDSVFTSIMRSPVLGSLKHQDQCFKEEAKLVKDEVVRWMETFSVVYGRRYPSLAFDPNLRGSMGEWTKRGPPDEFDFLLMMYNLSEFSQMPVPVSVNIDWPFPVDFSKCQFYGLFRRGCNGFDLSSTEYEEVLLKSQPSVAIDAYVRGKAFGSGQFKWNDNRLEMIFNKLYTMKKALLLSVKLHQNAQEASRRGWIEGIISVALVMEKYVKKDDCIRSIFHAEEWASAFDVYV